VFAEGEDHTVLPATFSIYRAALTTQCSKKNFFANLTNSLNKKCANSDDCCDSQSQLRFSDWKVKTDSIHSTYSKLGISGVYAVCLYFPVAKPQLTLAVAAVVAVCTLFVK